LERRLDEIDQRMQLAFRGRLELGQAKLAAMAGQLDSLSPLNVLARGYSLTRTVEGSRIIRSVSDVAAGEDVEILVADGRLTASVVSVAAGVKA
ncbi:MAG: exodeoxyribonuclease VII large subunit, partial [Planctomycetota bacterium]